MGLWVFVMVVFVVLSLPSGWACGFVVCVVLRLVSLFRFVLCFGLGCFDCVWFGFWCL